MDWTVELFFPRDIVQTIDLKGSNRMVTTRPSWALSPRPATALRLGSTGSSVCSSARRAASGKPRAWSRNMARPGCGRIVRIDVRPFFRAAATRPGAGLIWGLGCAFLAWADIPRRDSSALGRPLRRDADDAREHFPELVASLVCLGLPVGVALGIRGGLYAVAGQEFHWGRAIVGGGFAGTSAG